MKENQKNNVASITQHMGERLTMFHLYHYLDWDVEYVDYVGADIIAIDHCQQKKYAISVKTRKMSEKWNGNKVTPESRSVTSFRDTDAMLLRCFANDMGMEALVAYVVVFQSIGKEKGNNSAFLFLIGLDDLEDMRDDSSINYVMAHTDQQTTGFSLRFGGGKESLLNQLCSDSRITWFKMEITDHQIAKSLNSKHKITNDHLISEHWNKQQGTFGENLALWNLGKNHDMRGFHVDSVGADIMLLDSKNVNDYNEQYAVSVKTFTYDKSRYYQFEKTNEEKLIAYSKRWTLDKTESVTMNSMICFNCVRYNEENKVCKIYMIAFNISHVDKISHKKYIYRTSGGITIRYDDESINEMKNDPGIIFDEIDFTHHNYHMQDNS